MIHKIVAGADELSASLRLAATRIQPRINQLTRFHAQLLTTRVMANASGRPGPNAPTGDYRRSWNAQYHKEGDQLVADVGTNRPQGRRLEFGFHGVDSLGRFYNQPPYPHVWPAVEAIAPMYQKSVEAALAEAGLR